MPEIDILEQGRKRRELDKHAFELKISKRTERISIISIIISLFTLAFIIYTYCGRTPENTNIANTPVTQAINKEIKDK